MNWEKLLSSRRIRDLADGRESFRLSEDQRSEFSRDYGRTVFSAPVRRLQDKAQVFPLDEHDSVRTRLTHSIEVSCVARGLAEQIGQSLIKKNALNRDQVASIVEIAAACGLIHDLGNPPFGHAGEQAIRDWFASEKEQILDEEGRHSESEDQLLQDYLNFEGNAQTIRILSRLQLVADQHGLNLTAGTLSAANKYLAPSDKVDSNRHPYKKPGFFASEHDLIRRVRKETGTGSARNPITLMVEAGDDIVYATGDLHDGVKKGVLQWAIVEERVADGCGHGKELVQRAKNYVDRGALEGQDRDEALAQMFGVFASTHLVGCAVASFMEHYDEIMRGEFEDELLTESEGSDLLRTCKRVAKQMLYTDSSILRLEVMGRAVIRDLLNIFFEGAGGHARDRNRFDRKIYELTSSNYRAVYEASLQKSGLPDWYCRVQLAADYVSGMTDTFACSLHQRLLNSM